MYSIKDIFTTREFEYKTKYFFDKHFFGDETIQYNELYERLVEPLELQYIPAFDMDTIITECETCEHIHSIRMEERAPTRVLSFTCEEYTFIFDEYKRTLTIQIADEMAPILNVRKEQLCRTYDFQNSGFPNVYTLIDIARSTNKHYIHPYIQLMKYLGTDLVKQDEAVFLAVTDRIYQWCLKYIPNYNEFFGDEPAFSISFFDEGTVLLSTSEVIESKVNVERIMLRSEWKIGVEAFLTDFARALLKKIALDKDYAENVCHIMTDNIMKGKHEFYDDFKLMNLSMFDYLVDPYKDAVMAMVKGEVKSPAKTMAGRWRITQYYFDGETLYFDEMVAAANKLVGPYNVIVSDTFEDKNQQKTLTMRFKTFTAIYSEEPSLLSISAHKHTVEVLKLDKQTIICEDKKNSHQLNFGRLKRLDQYLLKRIQEEEELQNKINSDSWFDVYVKTIQSVASDVAPFIGAYGKCKSRLDIFEMIVSIPQAHVLVVNLKRISDKTSRSFNRIAELNLDIPNYMDAWRSFFSVWRMEALKECKNEYLDVCDKYERIERALNETDLI